MASGAFTRDVAIVGGCGHVGLPLGIALADAGLTTVLYDINEAGISLVNKGELPFKEPGADQLLERVLAEKRLEATSDPSVVSEARNIILAIGTPIDEHLNPNLMAVRNAIDELADHIVDGQLLVLRSTVYPGVTAMVEEFIKRRGLAVDVAFCPERIAEGHALTELYELPQIVGSRTASGAERSADLFRTLTDKIVHLSPEEAELAKLFTNTWRYTKFAIANQLYTIANDRGLDFERIRSALVSDYPRAADLPRAGFAAGPCLFKDTMQLAAFNDNNFTLGHSAMMVNEGLPLYVVSKVAERYDLSAMTVGILGMAFKAECDDIRSSLSYKLKKILAFSGASVLTTDPFVSVDPELRPVGEVVERSDLLIIGAPHAEYAGLETDTPIIDIWNLRGKGVRV